MFNNLPVELITKIIFYLEHIYIYNIILTNKKLFNQDYQKICLPQIIKNKFIMPSEDTIELYNIIHLLQKDYNYRLIDYLHDLSDIIDSEIYLKKRDNNFSIFDSRFKPKKTVNLIYNDINFTKKKYVSTVSIHDTYRVNKFTYLQLKKNHLNVLALIY